MTEDVKTQPMLLKGVVFFMLTALTLLGFQTILQGWLAPWGVFPDLYLILTLYLGLNAPILTGTILVSALGFLRDATGGAIYGYSAALFIIALLVTTQVRQKLDPASPGYLILMILALSLWTELLSWVGLYFLGQAPMVAPTSWSAPIVLTALSSTVTAVLGPLVFRLLDWLQPLVQPDVEHKA